MGCVLLGRGRALATAARLAVIFVLLAYPLLRLRAFYAAEEAAGRSNARVWQVVAALDRLSTDASPVRLDRELRHQRLTAGGNLLGVLDGMLDTLDTPHEKVKPAEQLDLAPGTVIVLSQGQVDGLAKSLRLDPVDLGAPLAPAAPGAYGVYRVAGRR